MRRRDFVRRLPAVTTGLVVGVTSLPLAACAGTPYLVPRLGPRGLTITLGDIGETGVFLQGPGMDRPVWLGRDESGELVALLASCTHRGCQPEPVGERFVCPCHGSEFSLSGAVLQGPAERPLTRYGVTRDGDEITVRIPGREDR